MDALAQKKITEATQLISEAEKRFFFKIEILNS